MPGQAWQQLPIPVAAGLQPSHVAGSIAVTGQPAGTTRVTVQDRLLLESPAGKTVTLDAAVGAGDFTGAQLVLGLEYVPAVRNVCAAGEFVATLSNISLTTSGTETPPTTVAEFLAPAVPAFLIPVPADPAPDASAAIVAATSAMARRNPDARLSVVPASQLAVKAGALPAGSRIITVTSEAENVSTTLACEAGRPALVLAGSGEAPPRRHWPAPTPPWRTAEPSPA